MFSDAVSISKWRPFWIGSSIPRTAKTRRNCRWEKIATRPTKDRAIGGGIQEPVRMPRCGQGCGFRLAIADDAADNKIGMVVHRTERKTERIAQLAALVNGARALW